MNKLNAKYEILFCLTLSTAKDHVFTGRHFVCVTGAAAAERGDQSRDPAGQARARNLQPRVSTIQVSPPLSHEPFFPELSLF